MGQRDAVKMIKGAKGFFETTVMKLNQCDSAKLTMKEWIGHYDGKVIQFQTDTELFHIVVAAENIRVSDGEYPSPDVIFRGPSELIVDVFKLKHNLESAMKNWEIVVLGAGHDGFALRDLIATLFCEA